MSKAFMHMIILLVNVRIELNLLLRLKVFLVQII